MKKLLLMSLLIINGFAVADNPQITINLRFNNQLPGLQNAVRAYVGGLTQYDENMNAIADVPFDNVDLAPNQTYEVTIPALATYNVPVLFYDAEGNIIDEDVFHTTITVTEAGQTIDLPFVPAAENDNDDDDNDNNDDEQEHKQQAAGQ